MAGAGTSRRLLPPPSGTSPSRYLTRHAVRLPPARVLRIGQTPLSLELSNPDAGPRPPPTAAAPDAVTNPWLQQYAAARSSLNYEYDYYIDDAWVRATALFCFLAPLHAAFLVLDRV